MRCPSCGALNPAAATWCGQCLTRFAAADATSAVASDPPPSDAGPASAAEDGRPLDEASDPTASDEDAVHDASLPDARVRDVRTVAGEVEWRCRVCDGWNALLLPACVTCGTVREGFGAVPGAREPITTSVRALLLASAVCPGAGHVLAGRRGPGAARALLWVLWAGGARLLASAAGTGDARAPGLVLAVGAGVLWIATLRDTAALAGSARTSGAPVDPRPWLGGRALAILVAVVTGGLLLSLVLATAG